MILPKKLLRTAAVTAALTCLCTLAASAASLGVGTVEADSLRLRAEASTEADVLATAAYGDAVVVLEDVGDGWYKVDYDATEGYMSGEYLTVETQADVTIGYGIVNTDGSTLNVRSGPSTDSEKVVALYNGTVVTITGIDDGWYKISTRNGTTGYVNSEYMLTCKDSAGSRGDDIPTASYSGLGQQAVDYALQYMGCPYVYGGNGPNSFDCSGFTSYVYRHFGYTLNRTASGQLSNGQAVSMSELQPGDLVFFRYNTSKAASHVGIYIGGGQFVHASTNTYTVRIDSLTSGHYYNVFVGGRRIM